MLKARGRKAWGSIDKYRTWHDAAWIRWSVFSQVKIIHSYLHKTFKTIKIHRGVPYPTKRYRINNKRYLPWTMPRTATLTFTSLCHIPRLKQPLLQRMYDILEADIRKCSRRVTWGVRKTSCRRRVASCVLCLNKVSP